MKLFRKALAVLAAAVLSVTAMCGITSVTVSGAEESVKFDAATGVLTSGKNGGMAYLEFYDNSGENRKSVAPTADAVLNYDIEIKKGSAYINPHTTDFAIGNAFTDIARANAGLGEVGNKHLSVAHYIGSVPTAEIGWGTDKPSGSIMIKMFGETELVINEMRLTALKDKVVVKSDFLESYNCKIINDTAGVTADGDTNTVTAMENSATVYFELRDSDGGVRNIVPDEKVMLYYNFKVEGVEHNIEETPDQHIYHGRVSVSPKYEEGTTPVLDAFMKAVADNSGARLLEGRLPAGEYEGTVDLTSVWNKGDSTNCIALSLGEYTRIAVHKMQFVNSEIMLEDIEGKNLLTLFKIAKGDMDKIDADTSDRVFTSHENGGTIMLYEDGYPKITPDEKAVLYYEFTIEPVDHNVDSEDSYVHDNYHGKASVYPIYGNTSIQEEFLTKVSEDNGVRIYDGNRLPAGEYKGTVDLSSVWGTDTTTDTIVLNFAEYTKVSLDELKFVKETIAPPSMEELPGGNLLSDIKAAIVKQEDIGSDLSGDKDKDDNNGSDKEDNDNVVYTVTDNGITYKYKDALNLGMTDMYDASGVETKPDITDERAVYKRSGKAGAWISEANFDKTVDFTDFNGYLLYDFSVSKGGVAITQNFADDVSVDIASRIARKHGVRLTDGDKLPIGEYKGVLKLKNWPDGSVVMKTLSAWATDESEFTVKEFKFINAVEVTGEPEVKKIVLVDLLPENEKGWAKEFENRNADISGSYADGWKISVPAGKTDASSRAYFSYTAIEDSSLLLCYDFTIEKGEAGIHLRAGSVEKDGKTESRTYANGKNSLTLTSYMAAVAGVTPIKDNIYGEDRLPAGHYKGVIRLDNEIPDSFKKEGYSWWDCGLVGEGASVTFNELAFAEGVTADPIIIKTGDDTPISGTVTVMLSCITVSALLIILKKRSKA